MGKFHLIIVNKFLDSFHESILSEKAEGALTKAEETFVAKCKSSKGKEKSSLAHYKLFASPLDASNYTTKIKEIQVQYLDKNVQKEGTPNEWAAAQIGNLK